MNNLARNTDPKTSHIAASNHIKSGKASTHCAKILKTIEAHPNSTGGEIAVSAGIEYTETQRRISDLVLSGKVMRCTSRKCTVKKTSQSTLRVS